MELKSDVIHPASIINDVELTAIIPIEMINAQQQLITWCDLKLKTLKFESNELGEATEHAKKMKWKSSALQSHFNKSIKRIQYYEKIKAALLEGYYIVPNFPIDMFAIKTKKRFPKELRTTSNWSNRRQDEQELAIGIGEYKNPLPVQYEQTRKVSDDKTITEYWAEKWDEFEFPITMARPKIMQATSHAMALKIFDRIGIMPQRKDKDPVIIGQVVQKHSKYNERVVSFMIAWHLNTNVL